MFSDLSINLYLMVKSSSLHFQKSFGSSAFKTFLQTLISKRNFEKQCLTFADVSC